MTLSLYLLCGIPWAVYAATMQWKKHPAASYLVLRFVLCITLNWIFWPVAPLIAAFD